MGRSAVRAGAFNESGRQQAQSKGAAEEKGGLTPREIFYLVHKLGNIPLAQIAGKPLDLLGCPVSDLADRLLSLGTKLLAGLMERLGDTSQMIRRPVLLLGGPRAKLIAHLIHRLPRRLTGLLHSHPRLLTDLLRERRRSSTAILSQRQRVH
ncbi:MAG: hypothetical protein C4321_10020 [Chloroflexota bacterium]